MPTVKTGAYFQNNICMYDLANTNIYLNPKQSNMRPMPFQGWLCRYYALQR